MWVSRKEWNNMQRELYYTRKAIDTFYKRIRKHEQMIKENEKRIEENTKNIIMNKQFILRPIEKKVLHG